MKNKGQVPVQGKEEVPQNKKIREDDVFIREKIEETKKISDQLNNEIYTKEELSAKNKNKKKKQNIGLKLMMINTIIASFAVVILVFHMKGYF